jgi:hypothetical protein
MTFTAKDNQFLRAVGIDPEDCTPDETVSLRGEPSYDTVPKYYMMSELLYRVCENCGEAESNHDETCQPCRHWMKAMRALKTIRSMRRKLDLHKWERLKITAYEKIICDEK